MPTVLRYSGYHFIIFTSDHPPPHVHVRREGKLAKVLLEPIHFARTGGFNRREQSRILEIVREKYQELIDKWYEVFPPIEGFSDDK